MTRRNATWRCAAVLGAAALALLSPSVQPAAEAAHGPPLTTRAGVVAADDPTAAEVGARILGRGGNAVDAAAATAFTLGVVNPTSSGIGGGGFALVYVAAERKVHVYDFREIAPAALDPGDFVVDGKLDPSLSRTGGLAVGVPGEVAGVYAMQRAYGALSWRRVVQPAARLARDGFAVSYFLGRAAARVAGGLPAGVAYDPLRALLAPGGTPVEQGDRVDREALAATLQAIAAGGADAFYRGPIAADLVATTTAAGGVLTTDDLAGYQVTEREPLWGAWHGLRIATMPLPSSGGTVLLEALGILDALARRGLDLAAMGAGSSAALHLTAEALEHGFADRARALGDEAAAAALAASMLDPASLDAIAARIDPDHVGAHDAYGHPELAAPGAVRPDGGTSHLCVIDGDGNAVSMTTTVNGYFGSKLVSSTGVVLNNQIDDFALQAGVANGFGLVQSELNLVAPGKKPLSSMTPTLLFDGDRVVGCVGGSGGPQIISNVAQVILNVFVYGMDARAAVDSPRVHHQWLPDTLFVEPDIPADVRAGLERRGRVLGDISQPTAVQLIVVRPDGRREAAGDGRKGGAAATP